MKKKIIIAAAVLLAAAAAVGAIFFFSGRNKPVEAGDEPAVMLSNDIMIDGLDPFTGEFVEDGSGTRVENAAAVRISNIGDKNYEYIEFTVTTDKKTYSFAASTVFPGKALTVLEKNKETMESGETITGTELTLSSNYIEEPSLHEDVFELYESHGVLNIRCIGEKDINNVVVYYKQCDENGFFGGITYRTTIGSMKAGEIRQFNSDHFDKVVNITYEQ